MEQNSMTALVSAFARAYHHRHCGEKVFDDPLAADLLGEADYEEIARSMSQGISFFCPGFSGPPEEALRWVVDRQLAPTPLARAAFAEETLARAAALGAQQYLLLGAGYDTFAYRQPSWAEPLSIFELDRPAVLRDKLSRLDRAGILLPSNLRLVQADLAGPEWTGALKAAGFRPGAAAFCTLLGLIYYLTEEAFDGLLAALSPLLSPGSSLAFDLPVDPPAGAGGREAVQERLAQGAGEAMKARYTPAGLEALLARHGFLLYERLTAPALTERYFASYNRSNPAHPMTAFAGVECCLAVKQPSP